jgi:hypothetical protein
MRCKICGLPIPEVARGRPPESHAGCSAEMQNLRTKMRIRLKGHEPQDEISAHLYLVWANAEWLMKTVTTNRLKDVFGSDTARIQDVIIHICAMFEMLKADGINPIERYTIEDDAVLPS